jgi:hypothetical protein
MLGNPRSQESAEIAVRPPGAAAADQHAACREVAEVIAADPKRQWCMMTLHEWLIARIRQLNDAKTSAFTLGGAFYGAPKSVSDLIGKAVKCHEADQLDECDELCDQAENRIFIERARFRAKHRVNFPGRPV